MAIRKIFTDDAECLYKVCRPVEHFNKRLYDLLDDGLIEAINPVIISASGEQGDLEGCLSFPGKSGYVVRPNHVVMRAYDRDGSLIEYEAEGLLARCIMHECDHLDGHVYLEKVTEPPEGFDAGQAEEQE